MARRGPKIRFNDEYHRVQRQLVRECRQRLRESIRSAKSASG